MKVKQNGVMTEKSYEEVCKDLGFIAKIRFVEVTKNGTITFTCGKIQEVRALYTATKDRGYAPSKRLTEVVRRG